MGYLFEQDFLILRDVTTVKINGKDRSLSRVDERGERH